MLEIVDNGDDDDLYKLVIELEHAKLGEKLIGAHKKGDDLRDALRYCAMAMPWDLSDLSFSELAAEEQEKRDAPVKRILTPQELEIEAMARQIEERRALFDDPRQKSEVTWDVEYNSEIEEMNDLYG
jgi:hypothetical protein